MLQWWHEADAKAKRALVAASLGWMLDAFDVMLYALVLPSVMADLALDADTGGLLQSFTLIASAAGGIVFGVLADRWGRARALILSVLIYSIFTAACGLAQTVAQLAVFRICLGIGMGGEWASGAALVAETWPARHRGKALAYVQSSWAIGYALAAFVSWLVQAVLGLNWGAVFFAGVLPALFALWVRRKVEEPEVWRQARQARADRSHAGSAVRTILGGRMPIITIALTLMNGCTMFAWWGFNTWVPSYLSAPAATGGVGLGGTAMTVLLITSQVGMWFGYVTFGYVSDRIGRRLAYVGYLLLAALFVWLYASTAHPWTLLALGPFTAFFATGYFSGFGAVSAELYPTEIRATVQGFTYNIGRVASAVAPWVIGGLAQSRGYGAALSITAIAFLAASVLWAFIPETKGRVIG
jgi:MFS family permease